MLAGIIAVVSLMISLFTLCLQFIAHDNVSHIVSHVSNTVWPTNIYFTVSLSVFNSGNRPAALISATADLVETKFGNEQKKVTDADCRKPAENKPRVFSLFATSPGNDTPISGSVYKFGAVIDAGKALTENLTFRRFSDDRAVPNETVEGVVCLNLIFVNSTEDLYNISRALQGVSIKFPDITTLHTLNADVSLVPATVVNSRHRELPF